MKITTYMQVSNLVVVIGILLPRSLAGFDGAIGFSLKKECAIVVTTLRAKNARD